MHRSQDLSVFKDQKNKMEINSMTTGQYTYQEIESQPEIWAFNNKEDC